MKEAGAIIIERTNVPQALLTMYTYNDIWGLAKNPWDATRSVGGSSGGCGGAVASQCIPLSFGTDIGGSIRVPAAFNGIYGFRCSSLRISSQGITSPTPTGTTSFNQINIGSGPLGKSVEDLKTGVKVLFHPRINWYDPKVLPLPFDEEKYQNCLQKKGRVGFSLTHGLIFQRQCLLKEESTLLRKLYLSKDMKQYLLN